MSIFGTDGIRGEFGVFPVDCDTFFKIGVAVSSVFGSYSKSVVIAKDTRVSSNDLEYSLICGLNYGGMEVISVGILPTSALSFFVPKFGAAVGIMISASHNKYLDNGLKFFSYKGIKLSKHYEDLIELHLKQLFSLSKPNFIFMKDKFFQIKNANTDYINVISRTFLESKNLDGIKIVLDVANGAATYVAEKLFVYLGATVFTYNNTPDGKNINRNCGAIYPENIKKKVIFHGADLGICLDGDSDRVVICDECGNVVDGDQLIASLALFFSKCKLIKNNKIVSTVMSSMALEKFLFQKGFELFRSDVGEHNVYNKMAEVKSDFGGENSGHFIIKNYINTSDGLLSALQILSLMVAENTPLSALTNNFLSPVKIMKNVYCSNEIENKILIDLKNHFSHINDLLIVIRKSGTEKGIIRIYVEGNNLQMLNQIVNHITDSIYEFQN